MKRNHFSMRLVGTALLLSVSGCATTPELDRHFGEAVNIMKAQQAMNPAAALNPDPVKGMDGKAAKSAYDAYQKSYAKPEAQPGALTIGIGTR